MKIKIIKKSIKEGYNYCIKSLFCSVDNREDANTLASLAIEAGATKEQVASLIKSGDYNGVTTYAFGLNCSGFTFDHVDRFGIIDADIIFIKNDKGYVNAKIKVVDKIEQIHGYEAPESDVTGWATAAPEVKTSEVKEQPANTPRSEPSYQQPFTSGYNPDDDLPF